MTTVVERKGMAKQACTRRGTTATCVQVARAGRGVAGTVRPRELAGETGTLVAPLDRSNTASIATPFHATSA